MPSSSNRRPEPTRTATPPVHEVSSRGAVPRRTSVSTPPAAASRREERRTQQQGLARAQLLDAAETVFGDKGVHASTIKEIADLAEYSVGSVYSFFESKDELLAGVLTRRGLEMLAGTRGVVAATADPFDRLVRLALYEVAYFRERPAFARLYLRSSAIGPLLPDSARGREVDTMLDDAMSLTAALIAEGQRAGTVCAGSPAALARILSGLVSAYQAVDTGDDPRTGVFTVEQFTELVARTFSATVPQRRPKPRPLGTRSTTAGA